MKIKPLGKRILVEIKKEIKTESGIILSEREQQKDETPIKCKVLAVSDEITEIKEGDTVIIKKYCGSTAEKVSDEISRRLVDINDVLLIVNE